MYSMGKSIFILISSAVIFSGCGSSNREQELEDLVNKLNSDSKQNQVELGQLQQELELNKIEQGRLHKRIEQQKNLLDIFGDTLETVDKEREAHKALKTQHETLKSKRSTERRQAQTWAQDCERLRGLLQNYLALGTLQELRQLKIETRKIEAKKSGYRNSKVDFK